jgi:prepilin-type N-terminal cleavage/methylation domain-containing protein
MNRKLFFAPRSRAFTLIELLVTIAIIGILAGLLLSAIARSKEKAHQTTCINNLHQVALGFEMYHNDFNEMFPAPGSKSEYGPQPEDWIWWQPNRDVTQSPIARFIGNFNAALFTCPDDYTARSLQARPDTTGANPYPYSFSITSYSMDTDNHNPGMATIIDQQRNVYPFKISSVNRPSSKIMLAEEDRGTLDDARWVPLTDLSARHAGKGDDIFADGHTQTVPPEFGDDPANSDPSQ